MVQREIERVLALYPGDCRPRAIEPVSAPDSFSGAQLWRVVSARGPLALRRWPKGHPDQQRLEFIQAVLWHVDQEGFHDVPLPLETNHHHGYVWHAGHLWELSPWLPGAADYALHPSSARLENAMTTLARFHRAASTFPLPDAGQLASPGIAERLARLESLLGGHVAELRLAVDPRIWPELAGRAEHLLALFAAAAPGIWEVLKPAARLKLRLQPCIRDIWRANVLFVGDVVSGIVDFGSMRPENVAADVARLLGSLAVDNLDEWHRGLAAYQTVRRLSDDELTLVTAFDRSTVLMAGLQWLEWIYLERRSFSAPQAVLARVDEFTSRLANLCPTPE